MASPMMQFSYSIQTGVYVSFGSSVGHFFYDEFNSYSARSTCPKTMTDDRESTVYSRSVLVASENATTLTIAKELLTRYGHEVVLARSVGKTLEQLGSRDFDVVFMDYGMGETASVEMLQVYRF